mgnify:CR=1 FL=1
MFLGNVRMNHNQASLQLAMAAAQRISTAPLNRRPLLILLPVTTFLSRGASHQQFVQLYLPSNEGPLVNRSPAATGHIPLDEPYAIPKGLNKRLILREKARVWILTSEAIKYYFA